VLNLNTALPLKTVGPLGIGESGKHLPPPNTAWHDELVSLVERMLELHKRSPRLPQEQEMVKREIESTDGRIDRLVYELYGLTDEEIKIVES